MAMTLSAVMNLTGNFAAQIQKNAEQVANIAQQAKQAGDAIKNSLSENIGQKLSVGLSQARDALGAAGVASAGFLKSCVTGAAGAEKVNADLAQTIKSTGGAAGLTAEQVANMASSLSQASTFSKGTIEAGQNMLLTFTNIGSNVFPQASQALTDLATKMKSDPSSAAIQLGKALNDPTTGLTALTRVGITFDAQQKNQIKTMQAAGDMAGAQKIILGELNKEFGGQALAASQTYDGQMKQLANTFGSIKGTIGSAVLPYLLQIAQKLNEGASTVSNFVKEHKNLVAVILSVTAVFGTLIGGASLFQHIFSLLGPTVTAIGSLIGGLSLPMIAIIAVIGLIVYAFSQNFGGIKDIVMSLVETVKSHIPEIKAIIQSVFEGIKSVYNSVLKPVLDFIISTFSQVVNWVKANWPLISQTITTVMNVIKAIISAVLASISAFWNAHGATIMAIVSNTWDAIKTAIETVIHVIEDIITAVMDVINGNWSDAWNKVCDAVGSIFGGVIKIIGDVLSSIGSVFADIVTTAFNWGKDLVMGIVDGIKGAVGYVGDAVKGVADTIKSYLHFSVPDQGPLTDYMNWMPDFMQGMGQGIKVSTHFVTDPIKDLSVGIKTNTVNSLSGGVGTQVSTSKTQTTNKDGYSIQIAKLADSIVIREDADIDKIATAFVDKLRKENFKMA